MIKYHILRFSIFLFFITCAIHIDAQSRTLRGRVTDTHDKPLGSALIETSETGHIALTREDGTFTLFTDSRAKTLSVRKQGYHTLELAIPVSSDLLSIKLIADLTGTDGDVVTEMVILKNKAEIGASVATVSGDKTSQGNDRSLLNGLQGKVTGLYITSNGGTPVASVKVQLRGATTFMGDNQPLIVVDGIPVDNSSFQNADNLLNQVDAGNRLNDLNPLDIDRVDVLKGPAAAALYGSRASNGVILISTAKGRQQVSDNKSINLTYKTSYSFEGLLKLPDYQNEFGQGVGGQSDLKSNMSWGPQFDGQIRPWGQSINGDQRVKPYAAIPSNIRDFFQTGHTLQNHIALSGGSDNTGYQFSISDLRNTGVIPGTGYRRNTAHGDAFVQLNSNFFSSFSVNYIHTESVLSTQGSGYSFYEQLLQTPRDIPVHELKDLNNPLNSSAGFYNAFALNPYSVLKESETRTLCDNVMASGNLGYQFQSWLKVTYRLGTNFYTDSRHSHEPRLDGVTGQNAQTNQRKGLYATDVYRVSEITSDLFAEADKKFSDQLKMKVTAGHNVRQRNTDVLHGNTVGLLIPGLYSLSNSEERPVINQGQTIQRLVGIYAHGLLDYKGLLFLTAAARQDWSSTVQAAKRYAVYPSAGASWIWSSMFQLPDWISYGKLRTGFASAGRNPDPYLVNTFFSQGSISNPLGGGIRSPYGSLAGLELGNIQGNDALRPERTNSFEAGLEMSFLKSERLGLDITWYSNKTQNIVMLEPLAPSTGYLARYGNAGRMTNSGMEITLTGVAIDKKDMQLDFSVLYYNNRNEVKPFAGSDEPFVIGEFSDVHMVAAAGAPFGSFFVLQPQMTDDGKFVVDSASGLPVGSVERQIVGSFNPKYNLSINSAFRYKNLRLYAQLDHRQGGVVYSHTRQISELNGTSANTLNINGSGTTRENEIPSNAVYLNSAGGYSESSIAISPESYYRAVAAFPRFVNGSFTRLREVTLSYEVPEKFLIGMPVKGVAIGISGRNLWLRTHKENKFIDPETNSFGTGNMQGIEYGSLSSLRIVTFNLKVIF